MTSCYSSPVTNLLFAVFSRLLTALHEESLGRQVAQTPPKHRAAAVWAARLFTSLLGGL